jgi:IBR domain, a half RING-finger domain
MMEDLFSRLGIGTAPQAKAAAILCSICDSNEIPGDVDSITKDCKHKRTTCDACMEQHISEEVKSKGNTTINCLGIECNAVLDQEDVKRYASKDTFSRYENLVLRAVIANMDDFRWCAHGCGWGQIHANPPYSILTCHGCKKKTCYRHQIALHENRPCIQCENKSGEVALMQYIEGSKVMRCPKCKHGIEKTSGCDHMTCRKPFGCGAQFCYRCGVDYNGSGGIIEKGSKAHAKTCYYYAEH